MKSNPNAFSFFHCYSQNADYDPVTFYADISLLGFSESLTFNHFIQPVGLPSNSAIAVAGQACIASGFGQTRGEHQTDVLSYYRLLQLSAPIILIQCPAYRCLSCTTGTGAALSVLRYAELQIIPLSTCNEWYSGIGWVVTDDHICAG